MARMKIYKASDLRKESSQFGEAVPLEKLVGKNIIIESAEEAHGDYGDFYWLRLKGGESVATSSTAITQIIEKAMEDNLFPLSGKIVLVKSKKRKVKGKAAQYYALT